MLLIKSRTSLLAVLALSAANLGISFLFYATLTQFALGHYLETNLISWAKMALWIGLALFVASLVWVLMTKSESQELPLWFILAICVTLWNITCLVAFLVAAIPAPP